MTKAEQVALLRKKKAAREAYKTIMSDARTALSDARAAQVGSVAKLEAKVRP